jgi:hypothetical protein
VLKLPSAEVVLAIWSLFLLDFKSLLNWTVTFPLLSVGLRMRLPGVGKLVIVAVGTVIFF